MTDTLEIPVRHTITDSVADILLDEIDVAMAKIQNSHVNGAYVKIEACMDIFLDFRQGIEHMRPGVDSVSSIS